MKPLVSILIPCYNASDYVADTIKSALAQTWTNKEIVVVDDGSTDDSLTIARRFENKGVLVLSQNNRGAGAARNRALEVARGWFIQFLDADDLLESEKIARQMARASTGGPMFLYSADWGRFCDAVEGAIWERSPLLADAAPVDWLVQKYRGHRMMHPAAWLVSRQLLDVAGNWDERLSLNDDGEFFDRLMLKSDGVRHLAGARSFYRSNIGGSLSSAVSRKAAESALLALRLCTERLLTAEDSLRTRVACATQMQLFAYQFYPRQRDLAEEALRETHRLGAVSVPLPGGKNLQRIAKIVGWKLARRLQNQLYNARTRRKA